MQDKLPRGIYALIDEGVRPELALEAKAQAVLEGGVRVLQLRMKTTPDRAALEVVRRVLALARPLGAKVLVNDRVDLALASGADGVHLGDDDLPPDVARRLLGPQALIGVTTRSLEDIRRAQAKGADHVGLGPIFVTRTKHVPHPPLGVEGFAAIAKASPLAVVGIAGITLERVPEVAAAGAFCAAVASDLLAGADLVSRARAFVQAFSRPA
jgi:thiamine-phosphate pyrophosphorylase